MRRTAVLEVIALVGIVGLGCSSSAAPASEAGLREQPTVSVLLDDHAPRSCVPPPQSEYTPKGLCEVGASVVVRDGCPFPACSCPAGCLAIGADVLDANGCMKSEVLGCLPSGGTTTDIGPCRKRVADGLLAVWPSQVFDGDGRGVSAGDWDRCDEADACRLAHARAVTAETITRCN